MILFVSFNNFFYVNINSNVDIYSYVLSHQLRMYFLMTVDIHVQMLSEESAVVPAVRSSNADDVFNSTNPEGANSVFFPTRINVGDGGEERRSESNPTNGAITFIAMPGKHELINARGR